MEDVVCLRARNDLNDFGYGERKDKDKLTSKLYYNMIKRVDA